MTVNKVKSLFLQRSKQFKAIVDIWPDHASLCVTWAHPIGLHCFGREHIYL